LVFHVKLNARSIVEHLTAQQLSLLRAYAGLLRERAVLLGLVSEADADRLWDRHILDSLRGLACVDTGDHTAVDLGSGAGLPGIPLAIALTGVRFTLVDPKRRRAGFLEAVTQTLNLANVSVAPMPAEEVDTHADLCLARALAPPATSWRKAAPLLSPGGRLVYWAGRTWNEGDVDLLARIGARAEICLKPEFQWQGPLVIMSSFSTTSPKDNERT
jgi:16S rRNA (guanine527-N7)-methyltransferase